MKLFHRPVKSIHTVIKKEVVSAVVIIVIALCVLNKKAVSESVINNLSICFSVLIPSLFPMLICSSILNETGFPFVVRLVWKYGIEMPFGLPKNTATASMIGFTTGYPLGIKNAKKMYEQQQISKDDAFVLALSCIHPGIPFSVLTVGIGFYGSIEIGFILFLSVLAADLLLARVLRLRYPQTKIHKPDRRKQQKKSLSSVLITSVNEAVTSILSITGWIVIFGVLQTILVQSFSHCLPLVSVFGEVTTASLYAAKLHSIYLGSFSLGFGGISLLLQVMQDLHAIGIRIIQYVFCRLAAAFLSFLFCFLLLKLIPSPLTVFYLNHEIVIEQSTDYIGTFVLISVCIIFMLDMHSSIKKYRKDEN